MKCRIVVNLLGGPRFISHAGTDIFSKIEAESILSEYLSNAAQLNHIVLSSEIVNLSRAEMIRRQRTN